MDPLSVIASTIAVVEAAISVSSAIVSCISRLNSIPNELLAASNEVSDLRLILTTVHESIAQEKDLFLALRPVLTGVQLAIADNVPAAAPEAPRLVQGAQNKLVEIEEVIKKYSALQNVRGISVLGRIRFLRGSKLETLKADLRNIKLSIAAHFSVKSNSCAIQSALLVTRVSGMILEVARENENQRRLLLEILQRSNPIDGLEGEQRTSNELFRDLAFRILGAPGPQQIDSTTADPNSIALAPPLPNLIASNDYHGSIFKLDISRFRKDACQPFCSCMCHRRYRRRAPNLMNKLLGSIFLGYSSLPFFGVNCDQPTTCKRPSAFSATFTYYFPTWFIVRRMLSLVLMTTPLGDPGACLKIRRIQYTDFSIFRMAAVGDWQGIRSLLNRGLEHPSTSWWGGWTPLHYAISNGQAAVCRYLLSKNADPLLEDGDNQQSALEYAWTKILGKAYPSPRLLEFQSIFTDRECLEELGFSTLHKTVLDLNGRDLAAEIISDPSSIDHPDNEGRTALCWAAQRGDLRSLTILLAHGANPNASNRSKTSPLHFAASATTPCCITPLLRAGALPNAKDLRDHTPIFEAIRHIDDVSYLQPLVNAGADVNAQTNYEYTPLICAITQGHDISVRYLLENSADINTKGQFGQSPTMYAVEYNAHECLRILLARGANCITQAEGRGPTLLHVAARHADLETLKILLSGIRGRFNVEDLEAEDYEGSVLEELVARRLQESHMLDFGRLFAKLVDKAVPADSSEEGEAWEDATENWGNSSEFQRQDIWEDALEAF